MYCSVCGSESSPGLKYCKACGARMVNDNSEVRNSIAKNFSLATILTGVFGMITIAVILKELIARNTKIGDILLVATLLLGGLILLVSIIIRYVLKLTGTADDYRPAPEEAKPAEFKPAITAQLEEHREPASVVEDTTRNLSGVPADRD